MAAIAQKTDPGLWEKVKRRVMQGAKGGRPGQWSARKAQMAVQAYKKAGGGYKGRKDSGNHLTQWSREKWGTKSGARSTQTGERYLPEQARAHLSESDYQRSTAKKRADTRAGRQFSRQPGDVARKTAPYRPAAYRPAAYRATGRESARGSGPTRRELLEQARAASIQGRSRMGKDALMRALSGKRWRR